MRKSGLKTCVMACCILLTGLAQSVSANDKVTISSQIPYLNDQVGTAAIRSQCTWNTRLPASIVTQSKGTVVSTDQDMESVGGKKLIIKTANLHAVGGGAMSGPKWITIEGTLTENGVVLGNFQLRRASHTGKFTACSTLEYISKALTKDVLAFLKNPKVMAASVDPAKETTDAAN